MTSVHRIAIGYLAIPLVVWIFWWCELYISIPIAIATAIFLVDQSSKLQLSITRRDVILIAVGVLFASISRSFGFFDATNGDWVKHFGILQALVDFSWPVEIDGAYLRYYLGYYVVPAGMAKIVGIESLRWFLGLWTGLGIGLFLIMLTRRLDTRLVMGVLVLLVIFSGIDWLKAVGNFIPTGPLYHLEPITYPLSVLRELGMRDGTTFIEDTIWSLQISSFATLLMFVPQHLIPGLLGTMMIIQCGRNPEHTKLSILIIALCAFWSPFVSLGLVVLQLAQVWKPQKYLSVHNLIALPIGLVLVTYIASGPSVSSLWFFLDYPSIWLGVLILWLEVGVIAGILFWIRPGLRYSRLFWASLVSIVLLSFFHFGYFNDLLMRATIPAMVILLYYLTRLASRWRMKRIPRLQKAVLIMVLLAAMIGPIVEYVRSLATYLPVEFIYHWNYVIRIEPNMAQYLADKTVILELMLR